VAKGTGRAIHRGQQNRVYSTTFAKDGRTLGTASYDGTVKLWDVASAEERGGVRIDPETIGLPFAFSSAGRVLAFTGSAPGVVMHGCAPGEVQLWPIPRQVENGLAGESGPLAFGDERRLVLWHIVQAQGQATQHANIQRAAATGQIGNRPIVEMREVTLGQERFTLRDHEEYVSSLAFSPTGEKLASAGFDKTVRLWDVATGGERTIFRGHTAKVNGVAFSPDGKKLASASHDRTVRLWDTTTGFEIAILQGHAGAVTCVAFTPDGQWVASGSYDKTVRLWRIAENRWWPLAQPRTIGPSTP